MIETLLEYPSIYLANLIDKDLKKKIDLVTSYRLFNDSVVENVCYIN